MSKAFDDLQLEEKNKGELFINRDQFEKSLIGTFMAMRPFYEMFEPEAKKMRIVIDYDPQDSSIHFKYYSEDRNSQDAQECQ